MKTQNQSFNIGEDVVDVEFDFESGFEGNYHEPPSGAEFHIVSIKKDGVDITDIIESLDKLDDLTESFLEEYIEQVNDARHEYEINKHLNKD